MLGLSPSPARAMDPNPACGATAAPVRIAAVDDSFDIRLDDGRIVRLAGLAVPSAGPGDPGRVAAARQALATWAGGAPVAVMTLSPGLDRWGRSAVAIDRPEQDGGGCPTPSCSPREGREAESRGSTSVTLPSAPEPSAAALLLAAGLARVRPEPAVHACLGALLAAEDRARAARLGLWAVPEAAGRIADDAAALARASGGFAEIEGILRVHASRAGTLYLSLGRDRWGFAAVLTRRDAARFVKGGLDVGDYAGTPVRLRGDLDDRFGARMPLTDPDQFQSLEPGSLDISAPTAP